MKPPTQMIEIEFLRNYYAPGGTEPLNQQGDIESLPTESGIAQGLVGLQIAREIRRWEKPAWKKRKRLDNKKS